MAERAIPDGWQVIKGGGTMQPATGREYSDDRKSLLLGEIVQRRQIKTQPLAEGLQISEEVVRADLAELANTGLVHRGPDGWTSFLSSASDPQVS